MKVVVYSSKSYDQRFLDAANAMAGSPHELFYVEAHLDAATAVLAAGSGAVSPFVNDKIEREVLSKLRDGGTRLIALRGAGFNNVDLVAAEELGISVARVPEYSPWAVAEHAVALMLSLDRKIHRAYARVREGNFSLEGLLGFDLHGRTVGIVGVGRIGLAAAHILGGFGCRLLGHDPVQNDQFIALRGRYVAFDDLLASSDIITLHCPLTPETRHLIDAAAIGRMKRGMMLINTSRGAVIDTKALIDGLKNEALAYVGLDVYEEEGDLFFEDLSEQVMQDDVFARLLTFPNVLVTGHQGFFTEDALKAIAETTIANISAFERTGKPLHPVSAETHIRASSPS